MNNVSSVDVLLGLVLTAVYDNAAMWLIDIVGGGTVGAILGMMMK